MKANFSLFALIAITTFASCADTKKEEESVQVYNKVVIDTVAAVKPAPDSLIINSLLHPPLGAQSLPGAPVAAQQNSNAALPGTNAGINPAHGQPGHRCDIAVGAPLNSKPVTNNITPPQATVASSSLPANAAPPVVQKVAPGMNPPHGQPNHRCDIAVGAPLNSKPTVAKPNTVSTGSVVTAQKAAPGMNPPHGEPNHRCDIAVGAPLNSKPPVPAAAPINAEPAKIDSTKN